MNHGGFEYRSASNSLEGALEKWKKAIIRGTDPSSLAKHAGLCLECQGCPGAVHDPALGNIILRPGERYDHTTLYAFRFLE